MGFHQASEGVLVAFARRLEQAALVHPLPRTDALGCQKAISPPEGVATTLRHPAGPSRGSRRTDAPSVRARGRVLAEATAHSPRPHEALRSKGITPAGEPEFGPTGNRELVLCDPDGYKPRFLEKK
jgi:hypothetical protein